MKLVTAVVIDVEERDFDDEAALAAARSVVARMAGLRLCAFNGLVVEYPGPAFVATVSRPGDALEFVLALRRELEAAADPLILSVALHAGEADAGPLAGSPVRRCARIASLAQTGQILVSRSTADLLRGRLPEGTHLDDLGSHRPRDLGRAENVLEVRETERRDRAGSVRSLDVTSNNLPLQLTSFVGREAQMDEADRLLAGGRILTLSGPGGCGKTRLALQVAARRIESHPDGVWVADLAPIADPAMVASAVADAVGVGEVPYKTLEQALIDRLRALDALLVVDNCEHLVDAMTPLVDKLLRECPRLVVLATSREPLGCDGEVTWRVPSLSLPADDDALASESVHLFVDRASAVRPSFGLDAENTGHVVEICRRLDGIPLAIELAAARARALTPAEIANQLADRFALLTGGRQGSLPRHRTLEASVDWSYALLGRDERTLLRRLSVFAGGLNLAAAEAVCCDGGLDAWAILDALTGLVDRSLVHLEEGGGRGRYRLLETIRQYAAGKLIEAGEMAATRDRHLAHFMGVAAEASTQLEGPEMLSVLADLDVELDNLRIAFDWAMELDRSPDAWRLAGSLWLFWQRHRADEGATRLTRALDLPGGDPLERAYAITALADLCFYCGDMGRSHQLGEEIIALATPAGDQRLIGHGMTLIGFTGLFLGDPDALTHLRGGLELHRAVGDDYFTIDSLTCLVTAGWLTGDHELVRASVAESLAVSRRNGNPQLHCRAQIQASVGAWMDGELDQMSAALDEAIPLADALRDELYGPLASGYQAWLLAIRGDYHGGLALAESVLARSAAVNSVLGMALGVWVQAVVEDDLGLDSAATNLAAAQASTAAFSLLQLAAECSARLAAGCAGGGDLTAARGHVAAITELAEGPHGRGCRPWQHLATSEVALANGDTELAAMAVHEAAATWAAAGSRLGTVTALELLARVDARAGRSVEAARLLGATAAERRRLRWPSPPLTSTQLATAREEIESAIGIEKLEAALAEGGAMEMKEAAAYARRGRGARRKATSGWSSLTATELEVVRLVAMGLKNAEIAAQLFMSIVTVKSHVGHVFTKLGVRNRAELAGYAQRQESAD